MDEAQRGREEEEGDIVGGQDPNGQGPRGGGRAWEWRVTVMAGDWTAARRMPPRHVLERGALLPPLVDCRVPIDGDGSNGGDWK